MPFSPPSSDSFVPQLPELRLLIVEDDPVMQLGLTEFFATYPHLHIVGCATDGYSAVEDALQLKPDLIIMDIGLPQLDGIAATQQIKAELPDIRILMLTSHKTEHETIAALSSGADGYCLKGVSADQLLIAMSCIQDGGTYLDPQVARQVLEHLKPPAAKPISTLSQRELEVLKLLVDGYSNPEIATELYLSLSTVKVHIRNIMSKLAVDDRVQAAVFALRNGLV